MGADGKGYVRVAQLRGRIAALVRGGRFDVVPRMLGELTRADLGLGLPADGLLRARQAAQLAAERGDPVGGPLVVLAATLLAADALEAAIDAAAAAIDRSTFQEQPRVALMARLIGGAAQRRAGRFAPARLLLDAARTAAARIGEATLAGLALAELAWIDLAQQQPAAAATCFEFAGEMLRRGGGAVAALEADVLAIAAWAAAGDIEAAASAGPRISDTARSHDRLDLVAYIDGVLADLALGRAPEAAAEACALAAESAQVLVDAPLSRDLIAQARLRQVRASEDAFDRARHLEAGIEVALTLDPPRAGARLGALMVALVEDAERRRHLPDRSELERLAGALGSLGDIELAEMARAVLAETRS